MAYTVLIVDDSATTRALIARTIRLAEVPGAAIIEAASGVAALKVLRSIPIHLVLADLHMPEMGGVELTRRMRQDPELRSIPVAVVTAEPDARLLEQLKAHDVVGVIRKPFRPEAIRDLIATLAHAGPAAGGHDGPLAARGVHNG